MISKTIQRWGLLWRSENKREGVSEVLIWDWRDMSRQGPKLFHTRREAREWKRKHYGYINKRSDLRAEPHGWKPPKVVKVKATFELVND